ncbi:MAG: hypothetical protein LBE86_08330 [Gemmobacter sp.]|nr:hypothetical protein [Gemmobacter sp.]
MSLLSDPARLHRVLALLQEAMGEEAVPLPTMIELMNRALRPLSVFSVFALVGAAFWDPARYEAGMAALGLTPWPVWALAALILGLHFLWPARAERQVPTAP